MSTGSPARRSLVRWSLRLFRREWRQHVLVLSLLTVAVAAAVAVAVIAVNTDTQSEGEFGDANTQIRLDVHDADAARDAVSEARSRFAAIDITAHTSITVPGTLREIDVRDQDPYGTYNRSLLAVLDGRFPTRRGEVALTDETAELFDAAIGSELTLGDLTATVVGIVENPRELREDFALVAPGTLDAPESYTMLTDWTTDTGGPTGYHMSINGNDNPPTATLVLAVTTLTMALVGLLAAAGFVVLAQRRQRQLGMLAAIGATDRQVRLVMLAGGAITGVLAAALGTALGIAGWLVVAPAVESAANHRIDRADIPWTLVVEVLAIAIVVATLAAWWPARMVARLPVVAALSGRPAPARPVRRPLVIAFAFVAAGVTAIAAAKPTGDRVRPLLFIAGLLAVVLGAVFLAPAAIRVCGALARRLPLAPRLALRDLARYQTRSAAALAAITLSLAVAVGIVVVATAEEPAADEGNLSNRELLIHAGDPGSLGTPDLTTAEVAELDLRAETVAEALGEDSRPVALDYAFNPDLLNDSNEREPISLAVQETPNRFNWRGFPYVATPEVLGLYGIDPASIEPTTELLTSRHQNAMLLDISVRDGSPPTPRTQYVDLPPYDSAPNSLLTEAALEGHGWVRARAGWIVESDEPLTSAEIRAARNAAAEQGLAISVRASDDGLAALRTGSSIVGAFLAIAIVAMAVGLIRSEAARDVRTLTATGAAPRTRRAVTASTAAGLAVAGVVLGIIGAYVALVASYRGALDELVPIPIRHLTSLAIGLPFLAAAAGWLLAGRSPRFVSRQMLE
jgi:putative ABC transport system permease protein